VRDLSLLALSEIYARLEGAAMYRTLQLVLAGLIAMVFALSALSRRFPDVTWLQAFRYNPPHLSQEQRARMRRRANIQAGIELILVGVVLPMLYVAVTVMFFNDFTTTATALVVTGSLLCISLGLTAIWRNRRS
jgi:hypothetical protein